MIFSGIFHFSSDFKFIDEIDRINDLADENTNKGNACDVKNNSIDLARVGHGCIVSKSHGSKCGENPIKRGNEGFKRVGLQPINNKGG